MRLFSRLIFPLLLAVAPVTIGAATQARMPICAIDLGSNTFRRIVGSFQKGRYEQQNIEKKTVGVGDDVTRHGRISDSKLAEIEEVLSGFSRSNSDPESSRRVRISSALDVSPGL